MEPLLRYQTSIANYAYTGYTQFFLAISNKFSNKLASILDERLSTTEVDLLHPYYVERFMLTNQHNTMHYKYQLSMPVHHNL